MAEIRRARISAEEWRADGEVPEAHPSVPVSIVKELSRHPGHRSSVNLGGSSVSLNQSSVNTDGLPASLNGSSVSSDG